MKKLLIIVGLISILFYFINSCKEEEPIVPPTVETASVDSIYNTSARVGGKVTLDGGSEVLERGIYWGKDTSPQMTGTKLKIGAGLGIYSDSLIGLTTGTKYYVKAYASNSSGVSYGKETYFTTQINLPTVVTSAVSELTPTTAKVGGNVTYDGGFEVTKRGVFWGTHTNPKLTGIELKMDSGKGEFSRTLTGLDRTAHYYVVAFATNVKGTSYGNEIDFYTVPTLPTVSTTVANDITTNSAKIGGQVLSDGGSDVTERGVYWGTGVNPQATGTKLVNGNGTGPFSNVIENLNPGTVYHFVAYAVNNVGKAYGDDLTFTVLGKIPTAITLDPTNFEATSITLNGQVSANDLSTTVIFEYGTTTSYGSVANFASPVTGMDDTISVNISGLIPMTIYHFRVVATNSLGTTYGGDSVFTTVINGVQSIVNDIEGNSYQTTGIGYQRWMTESLRTRKYNDGSDIPLVKADTSWAKLNSAAYCWYNDDSATYSKPYGALYNWYTVNTGKLCPSGWRVPTNEDVAKMIDFLGNSGEAGGMLKETGNSHWNDPNTGATNKYDFTAVAGGKRLENGSFDYIKVEGNYWSATNYSTLTASYLQLLFNYNNAIQAYSIKKYGMSVRCIKE